MGPYSKGDNIGSSLIKNGPRKNLTQEEIYGSLYKESSTVEGRFTVILKQHIEGSARAHHASFHLLEDKQIWEGRTVTVKSFTSRLIPIPFHD